MSNPKPVTSRRGPSAKLVRKVELVISGLLRVGVISSLAVVVAGLVLSFFRHRSYLHSRDELRQIISPDRPAWQSLEELAAGLRQWRGEAIIMAGLLLLIATPVMRVAVSIVAFVIERDWIFVMITSFVLALLILSFLLGKAGG